MNIPVKLAIAAVVLGSFAAATLGATLGAMSAPRAANAAAAFEVSVNRTNKADRLERVVAKSSLVSAPRQSNMSVGKRPLGCEPAFSPLAEPGRKQFFGRCVS
jgi:hypothetical protein